MTDSLVAILVAINPEDSVIWIMDYILDNSCKRQRLTVYKKRRIPDHCVPESNVRKDCGAFVFQLIKSNSLLLIKWLFCAICDSKVLRSTAFSSNEKKRIIICIFSDSYNGERLTAG